MTETFMKSPLANSLAVIVLTALIISWIISIVLTMGNAPVSTARGWFSKLLPVVAALGLPAALDVLQTRGASFVFAMIVFIVFMLNIIIPILRTTGKSSRVVVRDWHRWSILISLVGGLAVTGYLTFVESTGAAVMCGPLRGCNDVQNSRYAILFDVLPVGWFGLMGYITILLAWLAGEFGPPSMKKPATLSTWGFSMFGVLFSIYLTFLEPFVIGATCMWCITSAVLMMHLLLASTPAAQQALAISEE